MRWIWLVLFLVTAAIGYWIIQGTKPSDTAPPVADESSTVPEIAPEPMAPPPEKKTPNQEALDQLPTGSPLGKGMEEDRNYRPPSPPTPSPNVNPPSNFSDTQTYSPPPPSDYSNPPGDYSNPPNDFGTSTDVSPPPPTEYDPFDAESYSEPLDPEPVDPESGDFDAPDFEGAPPPPPPPPPPPEYLDEEEM